MGGHQRRRGGTRRGERQPLPSVSTTRQFSRGRTTAHPSPLLSPHRPPPVSPPSTFDSSSSHHPPSLSPPLRSHLLLRPLLTRSSCLVLPPLAVCYCRDGASGPGQPQRCGAAGAHRSAVQPTPHTRCASGGLPLQCTAPSAASPTPLHVPHGPHSTTSALPHLRAQRWRLPSLSSLPDHPLHTGPRLQLQQLLPSPPLPVLSQPPSCHLPIPSSALSHVLLSPSPASPPRAARPPSALPGRCCDAPGSAGAVPAATATSAAVAGVGVAHVECQRGALTGHVRAYTDGATQTHRHTAHQRSHALSTQTTPPSTARTSGLDRQCTRSSRASS